MDRYEIKLLPTYQFCELPTQNLPLLHSLILGVKHAVTDTIMGSF